MNKLGKGTVYYLPQNIEDGPIYRGHFGNEMVKTPPRIDTLLADAADVYKDFLNRVGLKPLMKGGTLESRCWTRYTTDGGVVYTLFNGEPYGAPVKLTLSTAAGVFKFKLSANKCAHVWIDGSKRVRCLMTEGDVTLNDKVIFSSEKMTAVASLDEHDIREGKPLTVLAMWPGKVSCPRTRATQP